MIMHRPADIITAAIAHLRVFLACWGSDTKKRNCYLCRVGPPANVFSSHAICDETETLNFF